ncbi:MAG: isochorismatase family protein [Chloroflexi bacterium]|nr:isochorismatase family protein [Chloroflexota bacterium]
MSEIEPTLPKAKSVTVDVKKSALLILDLVESCGDPNHPSHKLVPQVSKFLDRARAAGMLIVFTVSLILKGTPEGQIYSGFNRRNCEAVLFPDGYDKFTGGQLQSLLELYEDIDTLIISGFNSNINVLHTATKAVRELKYNVVIPIDGLASSTHYGEQYALFHLANVVHVPSRGDVGTTRRYPDPHFAFTNFGMIKFR